MARGVPASSPAKISLPPLSSGIGIEQQGFGHLVGGFPEFDGWPRFTTLIHQKMYIDWVRRAWEGGLRLMVALVVNNELLADVTGAGPADDRSAVETQLAAMKALVARHPDFMEIALTATEARQIIAAGRLAIVLGVEVDSLGNWQREGDATVDEVRTYLSELHQLGVRHMFPIHLVNNAFGGTAAFNDMFNGLNAALRQQWYSVEPNPDTTFTLGQP